MCMIAGIASLDGRPLPRSTSLLARNLMLHGRSRGPHSAGVAALHEGGRIACWKRVGDPKELSQQVPGEAIDDAYAVVVHDRFATRGSINERNAHPFVDDAGGMAMVHNGTFSFFTLAHLAEEAGVAGRLPVSDSRTFFRLYAREAARQDNRTRALHDLLQNTTTADPHAVAVIWKNRLIVANYGRPVYARVINHGKTLVFASTKEILMAALRATYPERQTYGNFEPTSPGTIVVAEIFSGKIKRWTYTRKAAPYPYDAEKLARFGNPADAGAVAEIAGRRPVTIYPRPSSGWTGGGRQGSLFPPPPPTDNGGADAKDGLTQLNGDDPPEDAEAERKRDELWRSCTGSPAPQSKKWDKLRHLFGGKGGKDYVN